MALAGRPTRLGNHLEEPGAFTRPGFSMGSRQGSFLIAVLDEVLLENLLESGVAVGKASGRLQTVQSFDQIVFDGGVELFLSRGALPGSKVALVAGLVFEIASTWHGAADKRPIPPAAISKGERLDRQNSEIFALAESWNRAGA